MVIVSVEIVTINEEIMILVQLPELAVDHVEVLVAEVFCHLVDVILVLTKKYSNNLKILTTVLLIKERSHCSLGIFKGVVLKP